MATILAPTQKLLATASPWQGVAREAWVHRGSVQLANTTMKRTKKHQTSRSLRRSLCDTFFSSLATTHQQCVPLIHRAARFCGGARIVATATAWVHRGSVQLQYCIEKTFKTTEKYLKKITKKIKNPPKMGVRRALRARRMPIFFHFSDFWSAGGVELACA